MRIALPTRVALAALALVALLSAAVLPAAAAAPVARAGGHIVLSLPGGRPGPLVLAPGQGGWVGAITVTNVGGEPLAVSRVAILGDGEDVRSPARLSVRFAEGAGGSATIPPGAARELQVAWMPDRDSPVRQAFGHVVVTSSDEASGEVAMGFRAQRPTGLGWVGAHALSLLAGLPLLVVLASLVARAAGARDASWLRRGAMGVAAAELSLGLWVLFRFAPELARVDGNEGFQLVERATWVRSIGAEWYLGVDGASVAFVPLVGLAWLAALVTAPGERRSEGYLATLALLAAATTTALVALDLALLFVACQLVLVALVMLVGGWGGPRGEHAAAKLAGYGAIASAALLGAFVALSRASGAAFLVDGSTIAHTLSIPELARTSFAARGAILGLPFLEVAWILLFVGVAIVTPVVPLHGWLPEVLEEAPPGAGILLMGVVTALGPYLLVRVGLGAMPEGAPWAGGWIGALGVVSVGYGGLCAMAQRDLRRFVAYASIAGTGASLFGIGAGTAAGIAGAVSEGFSRGLAAALVLGVAGALASRRRSLALERSRGLLAGAPALGALLAVGLATSLGAPGLAGFWGALLPLLGGFAKHPALAVVLAGALAASAVAHVRVARLMLLGKATVIGEAAAGADASARELSLLVPLAVLAALLGLWPTPLLSTVASAAHDLSAAIELPAEPRPQDSP